MTEKKEIVTKRKLRTKTGLYIETPGTLNKMETLDDRANQSRAEECDIKMIIEKYGTMPLEYLNAAREPLYLDNRGTELTLTERLKQKAEIEEYFKTLPASVRKEFNDNYDVLIETINDKEYNKLTEYGIFTNEMVENYQKQDNEMSNKISELQREIEILKGEQNEN